MRPIIDLIPEKLLQEFRRKKGAESHSAIFGRRMVTLKCRIDKAAVVFIVGNMVTDSAEMMPELRLLKGFMDRKGVEIQPHWISSAKNRFEYHRSRSWDPGDLQASNSVICLLITTLTRVVGKGEVSRYSLSGGEHPVSQRKTEEEALEEF